MRRTTPLSLMLATAAAVALSPAAARADTPPGPSVDPTTVADWPMHERPTAHVMHDVAGGHRGIIGRGILIGNGIFGFTALGDITVPDATAFNAGLRPFRVTVRLAVPPHNYHDYAVIQKGLWLQGGQWKMQVTGNIPSCGFGMLRIGAPPINDAQFHTISCIRMPTYIAIEVDGKIFGQSGIVGNLMNTYPVTVGGKPGNDEDDYDYFFGYMTGITVQKY